MGPLNPHLHVRIVSEVLSNITRKVGDLKICDVYINKRRLSTICKEENMSQIGNEYKNDSNSNDNKEEYPLIDTEFINSGELFRFLWELGNIMAT